MSKNKNSKKVVSTKEYLEAEKMLIERLKKQKEVNKDFLSQIENFIVYAQKQVKNNDNGKLEPKYLEIIEEEKSLMAKIREHLKKNEELIKSLNKSNFNSDKK